nr:hypothetical protein [Flavobacterium sp. ASV13]
MKRMIRIILICILLNCKVIYAQVGLVTNNPHKSAQLDLTGMNNKGLLLPNVNLVALDSPAPIVDNAPVTGLMVYNSNASLPALNGQAGGLGFYYWDGAKWCRMIVPADVGSLDNLGNHRATNDLTMSGFDVKNVNKLTTKTEAIAKGTDGVVPQPNTVAVSADGAGNVVWRIAPGSIASDNTSFYVKSTDKVTTVYQTWKDVPGLSNFTYTAPATGTLVIQGIIYARVDVASSTLTLPAIQWYQPGQAGVRIQVYNGGSLVDQNCSVVTCKTIQTGTGTMVGGFPEGGVVLLQVPVTQGTTYTFKTMANRYDAYASFSAEMQFGSIALDDGRTTVTSYIHAFLVTTN